MSFTSLVSIVIPVFNEDGNLEELIKRCLKVCRNLDKSFELILIMTCVWLTCISPFSRINPL